MAIIVSLTSIKQRYKTLHLCLASIFMQDLKPDIILLYLHKDSPATTNLLKFRKKGLVVRYFDEDFKPHNKYLHAMHEFPNDVIITLDDDAIYPSSLIKKLVDTHLKSPNTIIAGRAHEMKLSDNCTLLPYKDWNREAKYYNTPSLKLMATGVGGVLYPPESMHPELFNKKLIKTLCLFSDDIWLKFMQVLQGTPVLIVPQHRQHPQSIPNVADKGLYLINKLKNRNDEYLRNLTNHYQINWNKILKPYE